MDLSKTNSFLTKKAMNYIVRTENRKTVPVCKMLEFGALLSSFIMESEEGQI